VLGPNGLVDGVARLDFGSSDVCELFSELTGGKREGTVPALVRRVELAVVAGGDAAPAPA